MQACRYRLMPPGLKGRQEVNTHPMARLAKPCWGLRVVRKRLTHLTTYKE
jgi:hypothetical protein